MEARNLGPPPTRKQVLQEKIQEKIQNLKFLERELLDTGGDLSVIGAAEAVHDAYFDLEIADKILNQKF